MNNSSICERERSQLEKMNKFQLSNKFKKIGLYIALGAFVFLFVRKYIDAPEWVRGMLKGILIFGLLVISISKEKIEDEYIETLRAQSYRLAFIMAVIYALVQPFINYSVGLLFDKTEKLQSFNYFEILFFMLVIQLMFFWQLRRFNK